VGGGLTEPRGRFNGLPGEPLRRLTPRSMMPPTTSLKRGLNESAPIFKLTHYSHHENLDNPRHEA
jgi:hypothetical protein